MVPLDWPKPREHVCLTVGGRADLVQALRDFMATLQDRDGIFVHRYAQEEAEALVREAGGGPGLPLTLVARQVAFERGGAIDHGHVERTVAAAADAAAARGRGLSILADASHAYLNHDQAAEWFAFEAWLGRRLKRDAALVCLYWEQDTSAHGVLDRMVATHAAHWKS